MKISSICFFIKGNKIYLSNKKRGFGQGFLNGYGGKKKPDETLEMSILRELYDESGINVLFENMDKVAFIDFYEGDTHIFQCHVFFINKWQGDFKETEEMAYPELYDRDSLPFDKMWKSYREWLPLVCSGLRIRAKAYYNKGMDEVVSFEYESLKSGE